MSNEAYDEFSKASIPDLTGLDRQLLGHYATRFNEKVIPPRAWPPRSELIRITGAQDKSISRSLGRLTRRAFLIRITLASKDRGLKAEYAVNRPLIRSFIQVTDELPKDYEVTDEVETGNSLTPLSNSGVSAEVLHGYPKPNKPNKPTNVISYDRFNEIILKNVPTELRATITAGKNLNSLLDQLSELGVTDQAIGNTINLITWNTVLKAGAIVSITLTELIEARRKVLEREAYEAERGRQLDMDRQEAEKNKASDEVRAQHIATAKKLLGRAQRSS
jgi:hypothetical protein